MDGWRIEERPGRLGSSRPRRVAEWNDTYGPGSWRLAWLIAGQYHDGNASLRLYEDAYFHLLQGSAFGHHLEDIAIRRCLVRLGLWFRGDQLVRPEWSGWWLPGSVESFYQSNKFLLARALEG